MKILHISPLILLSAAYSQFLGPAPPLPFDPSGSLGSAPAEPPSEPGIPVPPSPPAGATGPPAPPPESDVPTPPSPLLYTTRPPPLASESDFPIPPDPAVDPPLPPPPSGYASQPGDSLPPMPGLPPVAFSASQPDFPPLPSNPSQPGGSSFGSGPSIALEPLVLDTSPPIFPGPTLSPYQEKMERVRQMIIRIVSQERKHPKGPLNKQDFKDRFNKLAKDQKMRRDLIDKIIDKIFNKLDRTRPLPTKPACSGGQVLACAECRDALTCEDVRNGANSFGPYCIESSECEAECVCPKGLFFDEDAGKCVQDFMCFPKPECGPNEVIDKCVGCPRPDCTSRLMDLPRVMCMPPKFCFPGCQCAKGFIRDDNGECIPIEECDARKKCGAHQKYDACNGHCPVTCANLKGETPQVCPMVCMGGCVCEEGYVMDDFGGCISNEACLAGDGDDIVDPPNNCGPNSEYSDCASGCELTCEGKRDPTKQIMCAAVCTQGCKCKQGFILHDGQCISDAECDAIDFNGEILDVVCPPNQGYSNCEAHCQETCEDRNAGIAKACTKDCNPGCVCAPGFVLHAESRKCIPDHVCEQLKPQECGPNGNFECTFCAQKTCAGLREFGIDQPIYCMGVLPEHGVCIPECVCKEGFYMDEATGQCVEDYQCFEKPVCGAHEVVNNCSSCPQQSCAAQLGLESDIACDMAPYCSPGCECAPGYIPSELGGECMLATECKQQEECLLPHQVYSDCVSGCDETCAGRHHPERQPVCAEVCASGCKCDEGYVMHNGSCITDESCQALAPPAECPANSELGCKLCTEPSCQGLKTSGLDQPIACAAVLPDFICIDECICKDGFYRDEESGECVRDYECYETPVCGTNEIVDNCSSCGELTCAIKHGIAPRYECLPLAWCSPGCKCAKGFIRSEDGGECISDAQCEDLRPCQGAHEEYSLCGTSCQHTCAGLADGSNDQPCVEICVEGCFCEDGYVRDNDNNCVLKENCPPVGYQTTDPIHPDILAQESEQEPQLSQSVYQDASPTKVEALILDINPDLIDIKKTKGTECVTYYQSTVAQKTWQGATDYCASKGLDLASARDHFENNLLATYYGNIWLNGRRKSEDRSNPESEIFVWKDTEHDEIIRCNGYYDLYQPNDMLGEESCLKLFYNGLWEDTNCQEVLDTPVVCERRYCTPTTTTCDDPNPPYA